MDIYHERQRQMLCAVHTLNNLFQDRNAYSKADLDAISYNLSPDAFVNPHKNMLGLGNYDVNVVMAALLLKEYEAVWFDKRLGLESLELQQIFGFVVNKPSNVNLIWLEVPIKRPHWFAVRKINDNYYNLDSKLSSPQCIGNEEKLVEFLTELLSLPAVQLLVIVEKSVAENSLWKRL
ncbi:Josephin-1 [Desmophyllum pertusum]|uniref:Josephin-2 n=1 Tax=Desmophyllum pertusum TaxID=174260 RepID=A0A9W9YQ09_9CNID|nr:Josephin-1 [Desmophyllum pertusum]